MSEYQTSKDENGTVKVTVGNLYFRIEPGVVHDSMYLGPTWVSNRFHGNVANPTTYSFHDDFIEYHGLSPEEIIQIFKASDTALQPNEVVEDKVPPFEKPDTKNILNPDWIQWKMDKDGCEETEAAATGASLIAKQFTGYPGTINFETFRSGQFWHVRIKSVGVEPDIIDPNEPARISDVWVEWMAIQLHFVTKEYNEDVLRKNALDKYFQKAMDLQHKTSTEAKDIRFKIRIESHPDDWQLVRLVDGLTENAFAYNNGLDLIKKGTALIERGAKYPFRNW